MKLYAIFLILIFLLSFTSVVFATQLNVSRYISCPNTLNIKTSKYATVSLLILKPYSILIGTNESSDLGKTNFTLNEFGFYEIDAIKSRYTVANSVFINFTPNTCAPRYSSVLSGVNFSGGSSDTSKSNNISREINSSRTIAGLNNTNTTARIKACELAILAGTNVCTPDDISDQTCLSNGFKGGGKLKCAADCKSFDTSSCLRVRTENCNILTDSNGYVGENHSIRLLDKFNKKCSNSIIRIKYPNGQSASGRINKDAEVLVNLSVNGTYTVQTFDEEKKLLKQKQITAYEISSIQEGCIIKVNSLVNNSKSQSITFTNQKGPCAQVVSKVTYPNKNSNFYISNSKGQIFVPITAKGVYSISMLNKKGEITRTSLVQAKFVTPATRKKSTAQIKKK